MENKVEYIANIISFFIILGIFTAIAIDAYIKFKGFHWSILFISPVAPLILFYKIQYEETKDSENYFIFKYKLLKKILGGNK